MYSAAEDIELLNRELGVHAYLLDAAPFRLVVASKFSRYDDPQVVSFTILVGSIEAKNPQSHQTAPSPPTALGTGKHKIWAQLYSILEPGGRAEVQFHAYGLDGTYAYKVDPDNINARLSQRAKAYDLGRSSKQNYRPCPNTTS
jgi:hypothetical protein